LGNFLTHDSSFNDDLAWANLPLPSDGSHNYLGDGNMHLASSSQPLFTTVESDINMLAMSSGMDGMNNVPLSQPMKKGKNFTGMVSSTLLTTFRLLPVQCFQFSLQGPSVVFT
jgi:hypothetical protein